MTWPMWLFWALVLYVLVELARLFYLDAKAREVGDTLDKDTGHIPCEDCHDV